MGNSKTAAIAAALLAVVLIAISPLTNSNPPSGQTKSRSDTAGIRDIQTRSTLSGQTWAAELFGRRYGRNLLAAVVPDSQGGSIDA